MPINTLPGQFELLFELPHTESRMESWNGILQNKTCMSKPNSPILALD
jgi:hypothetical protein